MINKTTNKYFFTFIISFIMGATLYFVINLELRWLVSFLTVIVFFSVFTIINDKELFLNYFFFVSIPIQLKNYFFLRVPNHVGGPSGIYHTFYDLIFIMIIMILIHRIITKQNKFNISLYRSDQFFLGIIIFSFLSMIKAFNPLLSVFSLFRLLILFFLYLYFAHNKKIKDVIHIIILFALIGVFIESLIALAQYIKKGPLGIELLGESQNRVYFNQALRINGTLGHANTLANFIGFFIPISFSAIFIDKLKTFRLFFIIVLILSLIVLIITQTRIGWVSITISLSVTIFFLKKFDVINKSTLLILVFFVVILSSILFVQFSSIIVGRITTYDSGSAYTRIPLIKIAINVIKHNPILGVGINNYSKVMHLYDNTAERLTLYYKHVVHNSFFLIASEIGLVGLIFFMLFLYNLFKNSLIYLYNNKNITNKIIIVGIISGMISFLIQISVMPPDLLNLNFLNFWVFSGILISLVKNN